MSRGIFDEEFDPADAVDVTDFDRFDEFPDDCDAVLDEDDIALLKSRRRPAGSGGRKPAPKKRKTGSEP